ncbi:hypothetical protein [Streptomyces sp. NPDC048565]|uniref:hypothetical protein n=1 Tax=Streptomyces sp. NPDC048565 TaxID=3155266 RepID=UPI00342FE872
MTATGQPPQHPEPSGETVLKNLIWLQTTRNERLAERHRLATGAAPQEAQRRAHGRQRH